MPSPACSDDEFRHIFEAYGAAEITKRFGVPINKVYHRRRRIEERYGIALKSPSDQTTNIPQVIEPITLEGPVLVFTDAHFWPGLYSDAFWIFLQALHEVKPVAVINNGDAFDGAQISRHPRIGWDKRPTVKEELEAVAEHLGMIEDAAGGAELYWNLGNHDMRMSSYLANHVPQFDGVPGMRLEDHFPKWKFQWGLNINGNCVAKHRYKGGAGAGRNNTLYAGVSMMTGHDHHLQVSRFSCYTGVRYGAQGGTLADPNGPQFADYLEGSPTDWQMGFLSAVFNGPEHWIEAAEVRNGKALFGGRIWRP